MDEIEFRLQSAVEAEQANRLDEAEGLLNGIVAENPDVAEAYRLLGYIALRRGTPNLAIQHLTTAAEKAPGYYLPWDHMAQAKMMLGQWQEAIKCCKQAIACDPENPAPYLRTSIVLLRSRRVAASYKAAQKAVELSDGAPGARQLLGMLQLEMGEYENAIESLGMLRNSDEDILDPNCHLAMALYRLGRVAEIESYPEAEHPFQRYGEMIFCAVDAWQRQEEEAAAHYLETAKRQNHGRGLNHAFGRNQKVLEGLLANRRLRRELYERPCERAMSIVGNRIALCAGGLIIDTAEGPCRLHADDLEEIDLLKLGNPAWPGSKRALELAVARAKGDGAIVFSFSGLKLVRKGQVLPELRAKGEDVPFNDMVASAKRVFATITQACEAAGRQAVICNSPPQVHLDSSLANEDRDYVSQLLRHFNKTLADLCEEKGVKLVDLWSATTTEDQLPDKDAFFYRGFPRPVVYAETLSKALA